MLDFASLIVKLDYTWPTLSVLSSDCSVTSLAYVKLESQCFFLWEWRVGMEIGIVFDS